VILGLVVLKTALREMIGVYETSSSLPRRADHEHCRYEFF
jgi:hypothetical protein